VDNNVYPLATAADGDARYPFATGANANYNAALATALGDTAAAGRVDDVYTFAARTGTSTQAFGTITTPIGYVTSYFVDPFANFRSATINYKTNGSASDWVSGCNGPDLFAEGLFTVGQVRVAKQIPAASESSFGLAPNVLSAAYDYDPTNGTISNGDVVRYKQ
jgi:hypothetical protein